MFNPLGISAARMADTAWAAVKQSGQISLVEKKDKRFVFLSKGKLEQFIIDLFEEQEGLCALTGLEMVLDGNDGDPELCCSLDRIESSGHYERGNLQIVCKFANRWKSASDNDQFKGLIEKIRSDEQVESKI